MHIFCCCLFLLSAMDFTYRLQQVCRVLVPAVTDSAIKNKLQVCANWVEKLGEGYITIEALIEACVEKLTGDIQQPTRELLLDLLKILYRERDASRAKRPTATIEKVLPVKMPPPFDEQASGGIAAVLKMT